MAATVPDQLAAGRGAHAARDWDRAHELLAAADGVDPLAAEDLELLADAAYWSRRYPEMLDVLERAEAAYSAAGSTRGAARIALRLARQQHRRRNESVMMGWFARAVRLLEGDTECIEYGWLRWMTSAWLIQEQGDVRAGGELAREVRELGKRIGSRDLEALGLLDEGCAQIMLDQVSDGFALVDEASALAMSGELSLEATGEVYCRSIVACRNVGDWRRASEWTESSLRWCDRHAVSGFPGLCHFHRAEVIRLQGALAEAERDAHSAVLELEGWAPRWVGLGWHEIGEIRRRRGDLDGAGDAFRSALEAGFDPQPGLALLHLDRGDAAAAMSAIRSAQDNFSTNSRTIMLPARVTIGLAAGEVDAAKAALDELEALARACSTAAVTASAAGARGELALVEGHRAEASDELRQAVRGWSEVGAPYETARARALLASALEGLGDRSAAQIELEAARDAFARLGAGRELERAEARLARFAGPGGPRATITFMFTDVVDSTKLVEALGDQAWERLLDWHDRTLRTAFAAHGGTEVQWTGDGFLVEFADSAHAIDCAVAVQRTLAGHRREHGYAPEVRVGLHSAEVTRRGASYLGIGVHVAARIGAAAGAGEVLASTDSLRDAGSQVDVGPARELTLKGVSDPVEVAAIMW